LGSYDLAYHNFADFLNPLQTISPEWDSNIILEHHLSLAQGVIQF
jgi:hypothetical protein